MSLTEFEKYMSNKLNTESGKKLVIKKEEVKRGWGEVLRRLKSIEKSHPNHLN